ncbi:heme-binding protein [Streptomyces sp. NPDC056161]|uniref:GlcG/HbpS family heme-binding protein n=1 Tax=Streptomyces sp. NPDC056161 TaxID=3345732 RepID=UPI0035DA08B6
MPKLKFAQASGIVDAALGKARELELEPVAVVVLDDGGHVFVAKHEDNTGLLRMDIAHAKAWGTLGMGRGGARLADAAAKNPVFFSALASISNGRIATSRGGVLIRTAEGEIIGAVGISGAHAKQDEECAVHGIEQAGFVPDAG